MQVARSGTTSAAFVVFICLIALQCFGPKPLGLADNGDAPKVLGRIDAWPAPDQATGPFKYFVTDFIIDPRRHWDSQMPTGEMWFARTAVLLSTAFLPPGHFDLRCLGAIHLILVSAAVFLLLRAFRELPALAATLLSFAVVLMFADIEYVEFLNTALMDAASITCLVLLFAVALNVVTQSAEMKASYAWAFGLCGSLFLGSKMQHQFCLIPLALFCAFFFFQSRRPATRAAWAASVALMAGTSALMITQMPADYKAEATFNLVFLKLTVLAPPTGILKQLDRPPSDTKFIGMHAWVPDSPLTNPAYRNQFWHDVTWGKILLIYLRNPSIVPHILWADLVKAGADIPVSEVPVGLGRKTVTVYGLSRKIDNPQPYARSVGLRLWSGVRRSLAATLPLLIPALYLFAVAFSFWNLRRQTNERAGLYVLILLVCAVGVISFLVGSLSDATDTSRHIVTYQVATDCLILVLLFTAAQSWSSAATDGHSPVDSASYPITRAG